MHYRTRIRPGNLKLNSLNPKYLIRGGPFSGPLDLGWMGREGAGVRNAFFLGKVIFHKSGDNLK